MNHMWILYSGGIIGLIDVYYYGAMETTKITIDTAKQHVRALAGRNIMFKVNKGRNKYVLYSGKISNVYPSIFTIQAQDKDEVKTLSYSYNDVLTKVIRFYSPKENVENKNI